MRWLLQWSFGCRHANTSFPQTVPSGRGHPTVGAGGGHSTVGARGAKVTYVTCLSCGQEFNYCWRTMQRLPSAPTWIEEPMTMTGNGSSRQQRELEELRRLWMT
jgi:hypothetical protein